MTDSNNPDPKRSVLLYQPQEGDSSQSSLNTDYILKELRAYGNPDDKYWTECEIGKGGMATTYRAYDMALKRTVVLKVMLKRIVNDARLLARFVDEARITSHLEHPNIVSVNDIGILSESDVFYSMDYIKGEELRDILVKLKEDDPVYKKKFNLHHLLTIFRKVCDACAFAHSRKILHRDIKPDNIMVGNFGEVVLVDWGLATIDDRLKGDAETVSNRQFFDKDDLLYNPGDEDEIIGVTPGYSAPEQANGMLDKVDHRTDVFLLGGTLYSIATLHEPYDGHSLEEVMVKAQNCEYAPPQERAPNRHIPAELCDIINRAMSYDQNDRYQNVVDMCNDIDALLTGESTLLKRSFQKDHHLMRENETAIEAYVILDGRVEIYKTVENQKVHLGYVGDGESVGEMALISSQPRSASVVALQDTEVAVINRDILNRGIEKLPPWMTQFINTLVGRLRSVSERPVSAEITNDPLYPILFLVRLLYPIMGTKYDDKTSSEQVLTVKTDAMIQEISSMLAIPSGVTGNVLTILLKSGMIQFRNSDNLVIPNYHVFSLFVDHVGVKKGIRTSIPKDRVPLLFANEKETFLSLTIDSGDQPLSDMEQIEQPPPEKIFSDATTWENIGETFDRIFSELSKAG